METFSGAPPGSVLCIVSNQQKRLGLAAVARRVRFRLRPDRSGGLALLIQHEVRRSFLRPLFLVILLLVCSAEAADVTNPAPVDQQYRRHDDVDDGGNDHLGRKAAGDHGRTDSGK